MIRGFVNATYPPTRERSEGSMVAAIAGDRMRAGRGVNNRSSGEPEARPGCPYTRRPCASVW